MPAAACLISGFHFRLVLIWVHCIKEGPLVAGCGMNVGAWECHVVLAIIEMDQALQH